MKKICSILGLVLIAGMAAAEVNLMWRTSNGKILAHGEDPIIVDGKHYSLGRKTVKGAKPGKIGMGSVEVWVEGAKRIDQLGTITPIDPSTQGANYKVWELQKRMIIDAFIKVLNERFNGSKVITEEEMKQALKDVENL